MSKVKLTIEYEGKTTELESDFLIFGAANVDSLRIGLHSGIIGKTDAFSLDRVYVSMAKSINRASVETIYKAPLEEARDLVSDLIPEMKISEVLAPEADTP